MTIAIWDGKSIAADRQVTGSDDSIMCYLKKIEKWKHGYWVMCGSVQNFQHVERYFKTGKRPPHRIKNLGVLFSRGKKVYVMDEDFQEWEAAEGEAIGTGIAAARVLVKEGYTAKQAAKVICKHYVTCGGKVDVVDIR